MNYGGTKEIVWSPGVTLEAVEEQIIKRALAHYQGNKTVTANVLGIAVRTLDNKLEKYFEDDQKQEQSMAEEKKRREDFLARCRGKVPLPELRVGMDDEGIQKEVIDSNIQTTTLRNKRRG